ncbi:hypothetical protein Patl1_32693 [Pistacia atlantica]|uniref:Uncharacterized protein n=1 Tax=Pistacia atlantica TaxID=434234 RepID=A0ACC1ARE4_9ROSI|nr:hypothetical protein Patl1_32693 [Pistacia atlantica]
MDGLKKLGAVLTIVFLVSLLALLAELFYVLWRKQAFRRRSSPEIPPGDPFYNLTSSKEQLLYFFCLKNQSRIEPAGNPTAPEAQEAEAVVVAVDDDDVLKWQLGMYGPSRDIVNGEETTPFSTPCASPPYYTPSPSPTHDKYSPGNDESFVSVAVCSSEYKVELS